MKRFSGAFLIWFLGLAICATIVSLAFGHADMPVASYVSRFSKHFADLGEGLGSALILSLETMTALALVIARLMRGRISPFGKVLLLACVTSICAYGINSAVLKVLFGVPNPGQVLEGARHTFHLWSGSRSSSFPSGHMMLAGAFAGVFMRLYPRSIWLLASLLLIAAILLIVGDWHFLSDVVAGAFLGVSGGLLAGEAWIAHTGRQMR